MVAVTERAVSCGMFLGDLGDVFWDTDLTRLGDLFVVTCLRTLPFYDDLF